MAIVVTAAGSELECDALRLDDGADEVLRLNTNHRFVTFRQGQLNLRSSVQIWCVPKNSKYVGRIVYLPFLSTEEIQPAPEATRRISSLEAERAAETYAPPPAFLLLLHAF